MSEMSPSPPKSSITKSSTKVPQDRVIFPAVLECSYVSKLGEGAYGKVYLVMDKKSHELKACKSYDMRKIKPDYLAKFAPREIDILLKVSHPNIIAMHRMCKAGFSLYMLMDYAEQRDMEHYISKACTGNINENRARIWTRQIANALEYLHEICIAHRDIKCDNILITKHLNAKLADFGFSRFFKSPKEQSNTFCGTASYAAPEIIKNVSYNARAADIWSLGVVLYRILNKKFPFGDSDTKNRIRLMLQESQQYTFNDTFNLSIEVKNLIKRILTPNPKLRPTAKEVQADVWLKMDNVSDKTSEEEKEALNSGKSKMKELQLRYAVVQELTVINNLEVMAENTEKKFHDAGTDFSEQSIRAIVCTPTDTATTTTTPTDTDKDTSDTKI